MSDIDQLVSDTFDELFREIQLNERFHPSEKHNRLRSMSKIAISKNIDIINAYHGLCKICNQHFYTRSVVDDINSFFQKHINTSYHRQMRIIQLPPDDRPMFTWEKELYTGKCHVCDMSGLYSYVLDTKYVIAWLMKVHKCVWNQNTFEANNDFLWKLSLFKKYCGLKIFREKVIKTINGKTFCLMCRSVVPCSGENTVCHLTSDLHCFNFCTFLQDHFAFALKDVFNGFNLEVVTRWMGSHELKVFQGFTDPDVRNICLELSNDPRNPYPDGDNCSFSPRHVEDWFDDENSDFISNKMCFLCNEKASPWHMNSGLHQAKAKNVTQASFSSSTAYAMFWKNRLTRQRIKRNYSMLVEGMRKSQKEKTDQEDDSDISHLKTLLEKKLQFVDLTFTLSDFGEIFCEVCDAHGITDLNQHMNSKAHEVQKELWVSIGKMYQDRKFMEPFKKIREVIICFLCGVVLNSKTFCSHLKSVFHVDQLNEYIYLNVPPISSSFEISNGFSCKCTECGLGLNGNIKLSKLKDALKKILLHWPCPNARSELEMDYGVNFKQVETAVKNLVSVFEDKILKRVTERTLRDVQASSRTEVENRSKGSPSCGCGLPFSCSCNKKFQEKKVCITKTQIKKTERLEEDEEVGDDDDDNDDEDEEKGNLAKEEEDEEVLVIGGLPKSKQLYDIIYSNFGVFGKILFVIFRQGRAFVSFAQKGVAQKVCKKGSNLFFEDNLTFSVTTRNAIGGTEKKLLPLTKPLVSVLENEFALMEFVILLVREAEKASNSPSEKKRMEDVCRAIIKSVYTYFPKGQCYPFGSRLSGLTLNDSDLDVFLDCGGMYEGFKTVNSLMEQDLVNTVAKMLRKNQEIKVTKVVDRARVPIVSFFHRPTKTNCDLSFKNGLSIQNTLLIKFLLSIDHRVKPMILFLKYWAKVNGLHGPPFFSSYAIVLLVVFYLEQVIPPVLPTIESLQNRHVGPRTTIAGWDCSVNVKLSELKNTTNQERLPLLLLGFFQFYEGFDYKQNAISPLTGTPIPRKLFSESGFSNLPLCYKRQVLNLPQPIENLVSEKYFICIIDPFDLSHNLTKSFTSWGLQEFTHYCRLTRDLLKKTTKN